MKRNQSIIQDLVNGWSKSAVQCLQCKTTSKRLQPFLTFNIYLGKRERKSNFVNGQIVDPVLQQKEQQDLGGAPTGEDFLAQQMPSEQ